MSRRHRQTAGDDERGPRDGRPEAARRRRRRRTWPQRLVLVGGCLTALALATTAAGLTYAFRKYQRLPRIELTGVLDNDQESGEPENYLLVGIDSADDLNPGDPVRIGRDGTRRTDTIMILRVDPATREAELLSLPRDLWLPLAGTGDNGRINLAIARGGPELLIRTIDAYFGIPIHHYVQVDFAGFRDLVDTVGGVPVYFEHPARDRNSGLFVPETGCVTLDSVQSLGYVRSRRYEELIDREWVPDDRNDYGRVQRQQDFIRRALERAIDRGARNPTTLDQLIDVGIDIVDAVDDELTVDDIFRLGSRFRSFDPERLRTYSLPTVEDVVGGADVLRLVEDEAEPTLAIFRNGTPADGDTVAGDGGAAEISPGSVRLRVLNGSGQSGQASAAAEELAAVGFGIVGTGEAPEFGQDRTTVRYRADDRSTAEAVERWLVAGAELVEDDQVDGIVVVTGLDWDGARTTPRRDSSATNGAVPSSTTTTTGSATNTTESGGDGSSATSASSSTTSTTAPPPCP